MTTTLGTIAMASMTDDEIIDVTLAPIARAMLAAHRAIERKYGADSDEAEVLFDRLYDRLEMNVVQSGESKLQELAGNSE